MLPKAEITMTLTMCPSQRPRPGSAVLIVSAGCQCGADLRAKKRDAGVCPLHEPDEISRRGGQTLRELMQVPASKKVVMINSAPKVKVWGMKSTKEDLDKFTC